jgi:hypothetical protein
MERKDPREGGTPVTIAPERPTHVADDVEADAAKPASDLLATAEVLWDVLPGHRVEIIGGLLIVTPPADANHGRALTKTMRPLIDAGLDDGDTELMQAVGVWFGEDDYAVPDFSIVDADIEDHLIEFNCYAASAFRAVLEVTPKNRRTDLVEKRMSYAMVGIAVYIIVDRSKRVVRLLTEPEGRDYTKEAVFQSGEKFSLPESVGAAVELEVDHVLGMRPRE